MGKEFADTSGKGKLLVPGGDVQVASGAYKFGGGSYYFDGLGDYIEVPFSEDWAFGAGRFTIDFWAQFVSVSSDLGLIAQVVDDNNRWQLGWEFGGTLQFYARDSDGMIAKYELNWTPSTDQWYHIALVRDGSSILLFIDGVKQSWDTVDTSIGSSPMPELSAPLSVGRSRYGSAWQYLHGYIDEVRITKNKAIWTANFLVPDLKMDAVESDTVLLVPGTADVRTNLLLHLDGEDGSTDFPDTSSGQHTLVADGNAQIDTAQSKFGGASLLLDGTGDWIKEESYSADYDFGSGEFTIDFWCRRGNTGRGVLLRIADPSESVPNNIPVQIEFDSGNELIAYIGTGSSNFKVESNATVTDSSWHHVALVRTGNDFKIALDGTFGPTDTQSVTLYDTSTNRLRIGHHSSNPFNGHVDEVRIVKGVAEWTSDFTPPTSPYDLVPDDLSTGRHPSSNGGAEPSTTQAKLRDKSLYFDGSSYLAFDDSADWDLGTDDFTLDAWVYFSSLPSSSDRAHIFAIGDRNADDATLFALFNDGGTYRIEVGRRTGSWTFFDSDAISISAGEWHHLAAVRSGNTMYYFFDGIAAGSDSVNINFDVADTSGLYVGARKNGSGIEYGLNGYLSEVRITKGTARWTSDFVPPIDYEPKPYNALDLPAVVDDETVLLLHGSSLSADYGVTGHTISNSGVSLDSSGPKFFNTALKFEGSSTDYMTVSDHDDFEFGSDDFTLDLWVKLASTGGQTFLAKMDFGDDDKSWNFDMGDASTIRFITSLDGDAVTKAEWTYSLSVGVWTHLAVTRTGATAELFVDGVSQGTGTVDSGSLYSSNQEVSVGCRFESGTPRDLFDGQMDEVRITKGLVRWKSNFNPADEAYPAKEPATKLLLHMNKVDGNTYFKDSSGSDHFVFPVGNAALSTAQKKFGARSAYLDGSGDYLRTRQYSSDFAFGSDEFTIDFWVYRSTTGQETLVRISDPGGADASDTPVQIEFNSSNTLVAYIGYTTGYFTVSSGVAITSTGWHHVALVRDGNDFKLAVDGSFGSAKTQDRTLPDAGDDRLAIGSDWGSDDFNGYVDEFRVTKGVARWTSDFTAPSASYRDYL